MKNVTISLTAIFMLVLTILINDSVFGYASGVAGCTSKSGTSGCSCHSKSTSTTVTIAGPATLAAGASGTYTVTVAASGTINSGVDIAASSGTLALATDTKLKVNGTELTHKANNSGSGSVVYTFKYTAPATAGTVTLYATGAGSTSSKPAWNFAPNFSVTVTAATDVKDNSAKNVSYKLNQNYPNPFNPSTKISFSLAKSEHVTLTVYDMAGKEISKLVDEQRAAGEYAVSFNASNLPSGVYLYKLTAGSFSQIKKMVLTK